jgi:ER membrane protein complex subunit 3
VLRHYAMILLRTTPKKQPLPQIRQQRSLVRGVNLRSNSSAISPSSFQTRKAYMVSAFQSGSFLADPEARGKPRPNPMTDPAAMEGMMGAMKGNVAMMVPQTLIMGWINAFFSGFVISKAFYSVDSEPKELMDPSSEAPVPSYAAVQIHVAVRRRYAGFGCSVGV